MNSYGGEKRKFAWATRSHCLPSRPWLGGREHPYFASHAPVKISKSLGGAKIQLNAAAEEREADNCGLLLEAPVECVSVDWFTRGAGAGREIKQFEGDPLSPGNKDTLERKMPSSFQVGVANSSDRWSRSDASRR